MNKSKIISLISGFGIIITTIIMVIHLRNVCYEHSMHPEWSLGAWNAVQITATLYGIVICIFAVIPVILNLFRIHHLRKGVD
jgi:hypothetical protein